MAEMDYASVMDYLLKNGGQYLDRGIAARTGIQNNQANQTAYNNANTGLANTQGALQGQMTSLAGMYGQDSPYAQALREQLQRKDAAAGRRSQYGAREVNLQAELAKMQPQVSNAMSQMGREMTNINQQARDNNLMSNKQSAEIANTKRGVLTGGGFNQFASNGGLASLLKAGTDAYKMFNGGGPSGNAPGGVNYGTGQGFQMSTPQSEGMQNAQSDFRMSEYGQQPGLASNFDSQSWSPNLTNWSDDDFGQGMDFGGNDFGQYY